MKFVALITFLALISPSGFTQDQNRAIAGILKNINNEVVPGATVRLSRTGDSTFSQSKVSNGAGKFEFSRLPAGMFLLTITAVGNKQFNSAPLTLGEAQVNINLPAIVLLPAKGVNLKEVVVTAKRPLIEQEIDKTVVNVESMISSATSNTLEVLEKTPGVSVGTDGEISLNGQT
ncbi:MAG TPA: carboxypeptidase-like regulatory domain-containing protein, partial [Chitinophagaceae bacterium]|nr:carboxypeptidase-like regulatory domain-containing protein [Chitinophagaceae bacterium]